MTGDKNHAAPVSHPASRVRSVAVWLLVALGLAGAAVWGLAGPCSAPREAALMGGIFVLAAVLWVTEALPLFATSLLVIGLELVLLANPGGWAGLGFAAGPAPSYREILGLAVDPVLVLFFGGFVLAQAAAKEGVDRAISVWLLRPFGMRPRYVLLGLMLITLLFSMWMSNTATTAMMLALVAPMVASLPAGEPFRKAMVLGVPFAANIGGMGTPIASPPNAVALGFLQQAGHRVAFLDWLLVAVPLMLGLAGLAWLLLLRCFPATVGAIRLEPATGPLTRRGWIVVGIFAVTVLLWISDWLHGLPASVVALLPAVALTATGIFTRDDLGRIEWSVLILIAGGVALGAGVQRTGLDRIAVQWLPASDGGGLGLLAGLVLATMAVGTFMSNTAVANLVLPIGISAAAISGPGVGISPVQVGLSIAMAASLAMALPISTPPNAMAYARGEVATRDMARVGLVIGALGALLIIVGGGWVMRFWGVVE
ncbi:MAG: DASS family sodium-coupled anion symporter [Opitutaceae bacterium]|nr:DASS family sodium-coupled anion symporter [Opitutaceae bacterium]